MKKTITLFLLVVFAYAAKAQVITYPAAAQSITRGLDSTLLTVKIDFPACTNPIVTINLGAINTPGIIEYIPGSLIQTGGSPGINITQSNISNLQAPVFAVSSTTVGQFVIFTVKRRANCGTAAATKDNIVVSGGCNFSETNVSINTYNLLAPSLSMTAPATVANANLGTAYNRTFTINNGGNGCTDTLGVWVKYPAGSATLNSLMVGATTLTPSFTNGDSTYYRVNGSVFGADNLLCNGETITFTENFTVLKCSFNTSYGSQWNSHLNNVACQTITVTGGITMSNNLPTLTTSMVSPFPDFNYCMRGELVKQTIRITNSGAGTATNLQVKMFNSANGNNFYDTTQVWDIRNAAGTSIGVLNNFTGLTTTAGVLNAACATYVGVRAATGNATAGVIIPAGTYIDVDIYTRANNYACVTTCLADGSGPGLTVNTIYKNQCATTTYTESEKSLLGERRAVFNSALDIPTDVNVGAPFNLTLSVSGLSTNNHPNNTGNTFIGIPVAGTGITPNATSVTLAGLPYPMVLNATSDTILIGPLPQSSFISGILNIPVIINTCTTPGPITINSLGLNRYSPCAPQIKIGCRSAITNVHCLTVCPKGGATPLLFTLKRITYGQPDNNNNSVADATGTINTALINDHNSVKGDTLRGIWNVKVYANTDNADPNFGQTVKYVYVDFDLGTAGAGANGTLNALPNATIKIYPNSNPLAPPITCTVTPVVTGNKAHYEFTQACRTTTWQPNDSLVITALYTTNQSNNGGFSNQVSNKFTTQNQVYSTYAQQTTPTTAPIAGSTYTCDSYNDFNNILGTGSYMYNVFPQQFINGCNNNIQFGFRQYLFTAFDTRLAFPNEVRVFETLDSVTVLVPSGFTFRAGSAAINAALNSLTTIPNSKVSQSGNTITFSGLKSLYSNYGGTLNPADEVQDVKINFSIDADCNAVSGSNTSNIAGFGAGNLVNTPALMTAQINSTANHWVYTAPNLALTGGGTVLSSDGTGTWTIVSQNQSNSITAPNSWIYISPISSFSNVVVREGATILTRDANGFYQLGTLATSANRTFTISAETNVCTIDSMRINQGSSCTGYPTTFSLQNCVKTNWLKLDNQVSQIQLTVAKQPVSPSIALCANDNVEFVINSAQAAFVDNPIFMVTPPTGLNITLGEIEYPFGSGTWQTITPTIASGLYTYKVEDHTGVTALWGTKGLPGTIDNPAANNRQVKLRLNFTTDCNFTSGAKIAVQQQADRPCGATIPLSLGYDNVVRTNPINITNAAGSGVMSFSLTLTPPALTCGSLTVGGSATPVVDPISPTDTIYVTIPRGIEYAGGFTGAPNATFVSTTPGVGGTTILKIKLTAGITPGTPIPYSYNLSANPNSGCSNFDLLTEARRTFAPLSCGASVCPNNATAVVGNASNVVTVSRPVINITTLTLSTNPMFLAPGGSGTFNVGVVNTGTASAAANSLSVEFFCGNNATPFSSQPFPLVVDPNTSANSNFIVNIPLAPACNPGELITAVVRPTATSCVCDSSGRIFATTLPVKLISFTGEAKANASALNWIMGSQSSVKSYVVQYSNTGAADFKTVGSLNANLSNSSYNFTHSNPLAGIGYYRLMIMEIDGKITYSNIIKVNFGIGSADVTLYPNPTTALLNISVASSLYNKACTVKVLSMDGKVVVQESFNRLNQTETIDVSKLVNGKYIIQIVTSNQVINKQINVLR